MTAEPETFSTVSPADRLRARWEEIALEARRRWLGVEVRNGTGHATYLVVGIERTKIEVAVGGYATLEEALVAADAWVMEHPIPGPAALRSELQEHGRKLALLTPRQLGRGDFPLYRHFRDRILPLAYDNLVNAVRMEALEDAIRDLLVVVDGSTPGLLGEQSDFGAAIGSLRGLVGPKEAEE